MNEQKLFDLAYSLAKAQVIQGSNVIPERLAMLVMFDTDDLSAKPTARQVYIVSKAIRAAIKAHAVHGAVVK